MLRRNKSIIADQLPRKIDQIVFCELSDYQLRAYQRLISSPDVQLLLKAKTECPCGSGQEVKNCSADDCPGYWQITRDEGGVFYPQYHHCNCNNEYDALTNPTGCRRHRHDGCWKSLPTGAKTRSCPYCIGFPIVFTLRSICNHLELIKADPSLLKNNNYSNNNENLTYGIADGGTPQEQYHRQLEIANLILGEDADALGGLIAGEDYVRLSDTRTCGKLQALEALLQQWYREPGVQNKVLVFSTSVQMLKIVRKMVDRLSFEYEYLDGGTDARERQTKVNRFNQPGGSCFLFLMSTGAGGVGVRMKMF